MTPDDIKSSVKALCRAYCRLRDSHLTRDGLLSELRDEKLREKAEALDDSIRLVVQHSSECVSDYLEFRVALLAAAPADSQLQGFLRLSKGLTDLLRTSCPDCHDAASRLVAFLLVAMGAMPAVGEELRFLLGSLTDRQEGNLRRIEPVSGVSRDSLPRLSQLLNIGLSNEVVTFLDLVQKVGNENTAKNRGSSAVGCVVSRKGGVGKSTFTLALALASERLQREDQVCIFDFDLTGPMWQSSLLPSGKDLDGRYASEAHLGKLITFDQPDDSFSFSEPETSEVLDVCLRAKLPSIGRDVALLSFADRPRTNRFLAKAIANNTKSFRLFLDAVVRALSTRYGLILIDNSPGFEYHTQVAFALAASLPRGCPIVVSSPFPPDIVGTMLEVSDLRFLQPRATTPWWLVNKVVDPSLIASPTNVLQLAENFPAYKDLIPPAPLLEQVIPVHSVSHNVAALPYDDALARRADWTDAGCWSEAGVRAFNESEFFRLFLETLERPCPPVPFWS